MASEFQLQRHTGLKGDLSRNTEIVFSSKTHKKLYFTKTKQFK